MTRKFEQVHVLPEGTNFEEFKSNPVLEMRTKLVCASLSSFQFDATKIEELTEDEIFQHTQKLSVFAIGVADTCLQIMIDNPYQHLDPTQQ